MLHRCTPADSQPGLWQAAAVDGNRMLNMIAVKPRPVLYHMAKQAPRS